MGEANSGAQVETTFSEGDEVRLGSTALLPAFLLSGDTAEVEDRRSSFDLNRRERRSGMMGEERGEREEIRRMIGGGWRCRELVTVHMAVLWRGTNNDREIQKRKIRINRSRK